MAKEKLSSWEGDKHYKGNTKQFLILIQTRWNEKVELTPNCDVVQVNRL